jgi:uncharacterized protein (DUF362 family)
MENVSIRRCSPSSGDSVIMRETTTLLESLGDLAPLFKDKRKIAVKTNAGIARYTLTEGRQTELTDPAVLEAVIRFIRERTDGEIVVGDAPTTHEGYAIYEALGLPERLGRYPNVRILDFGAGPFRTVPIPGEPLMFSQYELHEELADADAFVSVAKMKAHRSVGCTLCIKNLFGWTPPEVYGYPRNYLHDRNIRLPRALADLALLFKPCLNVVDGIVAANHGEWHGTPMTPEVLVAGTNIVATDAVAMRIMGFDPFGDYPDAPFHYRQNAVKLAAEAGLGPISPDLIAIHGPEPESIVMPFEVKSYGGGVKERDEELERAAKCVRDYRENRAKYLDRHAGRIVALRDNELLWDAATVGEHQHKERESGLDFRNGPQLAIFVRPEGEEIERLDAYEEWENASTRERIAA